MGKKSVACVDPWLVTGSSLAKTESTGTKMAIGTIGNIGATTNMTTVAMGTIGAATSTMSATSMRTATIGDVKMVKRATGCVRAKKTVMRTVSIGARKTIRRTVSTGARTSMVSIGARKTIMRPVSIGVRTRMVSIGARTVSIGASKTIMTVRIGARKTMRLVSMSNGKRKSVACVALWLVNGSSLADTAKRTASDCLIMRKTSTEIATMRMTASLWWRGSLQLALLLAA